MELKKEEKHIIVTGGSRGIGRAVALRYAESGWSVSVCSHNSSEQLLEVKAAAEDIGGHGFVFEGDMGNPDDVENFFKGAVEMFGVPDILVNNAGMSHIGLLQDMTNEEWNRLLATNLSSIFYSCRAVIPLFLSVQRGCIINISSVWGNVGASMEVAYSATKGGVNSLTKALARELAPSNIPVNAIACGIIDTDMNRFLSMEERDDILSQIPSGKMGSPQEVALLVEKLAGAPAYMTGQIVTLDGGWT